MATKPTFDPASITPFVIGNPDDGKTALVPHPYEEDFSKDNNLTRTDKNRLPGLTCCHLKNPNLFLSDALVNQTVLSTTVLRLTSDTSAGNSVPDVGGGTANVASLTGKGSVPTGGPNAAAPVVTATFWIEQVRDQHGAECLRSCSTHNVCCCISKARVGPTSQSRHLDCLCAVKGSLRRRYGELIPSDDCELGADSARAPVNGVIGTASRKANLVW